MRLCLWADVVGGSSERKGVRRSEEAYYVVDHGADVGADDVVRERGGVRGQRTRRVREGPGHHSLSRIGKEPEPTEVPADDVQEGQRQLFARGGGSLRPALSSGPVQGLASESGALARKGRGIAAPASICPYSQRYVEGLFSEGGYPLTVRRTPGAPAAQKDDLARREPELHPFCAAPAFLPALVRADLGVEPHPRSLRL
jgi:hypothetical protein